MKTDELVQQALINALAATDKNLKKKDRLEFLGKMAIAALSGMIAGVPPKMEDEVIATVVARVKESATTIRGAIERKLQ